MTNIFSRGELAKMLQPDILRRGRKKSVICLPASEDSWAQDTVVGKFLPRQEIMIIKSKIMIIKLINRYICSGR